MRRSRPPGGAVGAGAGALRRTGELSGTGLVGCRHRLGGRAAVAAVAAVVLVACTPRGPASGPGPATGPEAVTVASFNFSESVLLAEIYAQVLEAAGLPVVRQPQVGPREIMEPALEQGLVDVVPEYLGSALAYLDPGAAVATLDASGIRLRLEELLAERGLTALSPAPAENQNGVVVLPETAERYGLRAVSDLGPIAADLVFGGPPECPERPFCLMGLRSTYGLDFARFLALDSGSRRTRAALTGGEIDVGLLFSTDGHLAAGDFVLLADDRRLQPAENVVPVVRRQVVEHHGERLVAPLDSVSARLTTEILAGLNRQVGIDGDQADAVAAAWLEEQGFGRG